jgi:hypothetical protein
MIDYHCVFSSPVNIGSTTAYSILNCTSSASTNTIAQVNNTSTGAEFYLDKTINYGEVLILVFLLLFAIFGIVKIISDFFIPRRVSKF